MASNACQSSAVHLLLIVSPHLSFAHVNGKNLITVLGEIERKKIPKNYSCFDPKPIVETQERRRTKNKNVFRLIIFTTIKNVQIYGKYL